MTTTPRNYITIARLETLANITVIDQDEGLRQIDRAEQAIDNYLGYQCRSVEVTFRGIVSSANGKVVIDTNPSSQLHVLNGYFSGCIIEILGGTGKGQSRYIDTSSYDNRSITIVDDWDTPLDSTSFYRIYQLAKFPRDKDLFTSSDGRTIYKAIPDAIVEAVAAQIQYMIQQGDAFFIGNQADVQSESIGNYSYSKANTGQSSAVTALAPRVRTLLRGYKNSTGRLLAENPTSL